MARHLHVWFRQFLTIHSAQETTQQREHFRKSSLLALVILVSLISDIPFLVIFMLTGSLLSSLYLCGIIGIELFAFWLNRRGQLEMAALLYLSLLLGAILGFTILRNNPHAGVLWIIFLSLPTLFSGFFLEKWMPCIFGVLDCGIVTVTWIFPQRFPWAALGKLPLDFLNDIYVLLISIALITSLHAWNVERAVRLADRAHELEQLNARLESLATTDPLTALPNHRALSEILNRIWDHTRHGQNSFALLFLDIDHFKVINDTYGHKSGDDVLQAFAQIIQEGLRHSDTVGRWGGEEFVAVLPDINESHAVEIAERVRQAVASTVFEVGEGIHITCSIGVACYQPDASNQQELLNAADQAMYGAKHSGRNRVCLAPKGVFSSAA